MTNLSDEWNILEAKLQDSEERWLFKKNLALADFPDKSKYTMVVYFIVSFDSKLPTGLPEESDMKIFDVFEEEIVPKIQQEADCILVASVIRGGIKEHLFYISSEDLFLKTVNKYIDRFDKFTVTLERQMDSDWSIYNNFPAEEKENKD